ncbi:DUF4197 domain-containing protein [Parapedobacter sp. ISTM3]|uniref:DUF4197 domain-containing protein n=1 Tax=Parapedobacter luteus TaxID=623280 RepID=A0A1T5BQH9_9SPHI|nr:MULTISPECIES: DUF4197 domain-containing protein [Parapedobacter]MBK1439341.1 DUF4197 domain-containing protein [Parapedobacter sp. ISTM3]SKB49411.1 Protein of unknown function [Parapedobacter luteus]
MSGLKTLPAALCLLLFTQCDTLNQVATSGRTSEPASSSASSSISAGEAASGIKQALSQGLDRSIKSLAVQDGFLGNAAVKILMPPEAQKVESALRGIGLGSLCDNLIQSLNRAAESAVSEAAPVFVSSLSQLTIRDATNILLSGQQDAATDFFKRTTTNELTKRFSPIVQGALGKHNVAQYWNAVVTRYNQIPLVNEKIETDLNKYVTQKAIDGLFYQVAQEELKIRNNLGGTRTTPLLQKVFGYADKQKG